MQTLKLRRKIIYIVLYASLPAFLLFTDPRRLPLPFLWLPFILLFLILFLSFRMITRRKSEGKRLNGVALVAAAFPTLVLILASINQATPRDAALAAALLIGLTWYLNRLDI